jgi:hypothetical protein
MTNWLQKLAEVLRSFPRLKALAKTLLVKKNYLLRRWEGVRRIKDDFKAFHGRDLPDDPKMFTEKLFTWLIQLHQSDDRTYGRFVDKFEVREFVEERLGPGYLPELYWVGTIASEIPFDILPAHYVLKANHGSGQVIIVDGGVIDKVDTVERATKWLEDNFYWAGREYQYLHIKPRLMAEEILDDGFLDGPLDYRFWCFDGRPTVVQVDNHDHSINNFYDMDWNLIDLTYREDTSLPSIEMPSNFSEMVEVVLRLAIGLGFVRVDLYNLKGRIVLGELTFSPVGGMLRFFPSEWDARLGALWNLNGAPSL